MTPSRPLATDNGSRLALTWPASCFLVLLPNPLGLPYGQAFDCLTHTLENDCTVGFRFRVLLLTLYRESVKLRSSIAGTLAKWCAVPNARLFSRGSEGLSVDSLESLARCLAVSLAVAIGQCLGSVLRFGCVPSRLSARAGQPVACTCSTQGIYFFRGALSMLFFDCVSHLPSRFLFDSAATASGSRAGHVGPSAASESPNAARRAGTLRVQSVHPATLTAALAGVSGCW